MDWVPGRAFVIALAIAGGALSFASILLRRRGMGAALARRLDAASYVLMGASMFFFIAAGLAGKPGA